jgi:hypothetical protein
VTPLELVSFVRTEQRLEQKVSAYRFVFVILDEGANEGLKKVRLSRTDRGWFFRCRLSYPCFPFLYSLSLLEYTVSKDDEMYIIAWSIVVSQNSSEL